MSSAYESATLLLRLYELRREGTMRDARAWVTRGFHPESYDDVTTTLSGPHSAHFRMVTSYWDMAASLVLNGAIDEKMFGDANAEHIITFAKIEPFLAEHRSKTANPTYLAHLEALVAKTPGALERLPAIRARFKAMAPPK